MSRPSVFVMVHASKLVVSDQNVRQGLDVHDEDWLNFVDGIAKNGVQQTVEARPLKVRVLDGKKVAYEGDVRGIPSQVRARLETDNNPARLEVSTYEVFAGRRRMLAAQECLQRGGDAARTAAMVPVRVYQHEVMPDSEARRRSLVENVQRKDMDPLVLAHQLQHMLEMEEGGKRVYPTRDALAKALNISASTLSGKLAFNRLKGYAREAFEKRAFGRRLAEDIVQSTDDEVQQELLARAVSGLDVREGERVLALVRGDPTLLEMGAKNAKKFAKTVKARLKAPEPGQPTEHDASSVQTSKAKEARALESLRRAERSIAPRVPKGLTLTYDGRIVVDAPGGETVSFTMEELGFTEPFVLVPRSSVQGRKSRKGVKSPSDWRSDLFDRVREAAEGHVTRTNTPKL